jgi:hypothetical protein
LFRTRKKEGKPKPVNIQENGKVLKLLMKKKNLTIIPEIEEVPLQVE